MGRKAIKPDAVFKVRERKNKHGDTRYYFDCGFVDGVRKMIPIGKTMPTASELNGLLLQADAVRRAGLARRADKESLLDSEAIRSIAVDFSSSAIYFLLRGPLIVYVGQSTNVAARIASHPGKDFDRVAVVPCAPDELDATEAAYIERFQPEYNINAKHTRLELRTLLRDGLHG